MIRIYELDILLTSQNLGEDGMGESSFFDPTLKVKEDPEKLRSHVASFLSVCLGHIHETLYLCKSQEQSGRMKRRSFRPGILPRKNWHFFPAYFRFSTRKEVLAWNRSVEFRFIEEGELVKKEAKMIKKVQEKELGMKQIFVTMSGKQSK